MRKKTIKILTAIITPAVFLTAGIITISGDFLPADRISSPDMEYSAEIKDGETTVGYVPFGIGIRGDANGDENLSAADASYIASYLANISINPDYMSDYKDSLNGAMADADNNEHITAQDASTIAKFLAMKSIYSDIEWEDVIGG